jgi:hypothetical protein
MGRIIAVSRSGQGQPRQLRPGPAGGRVLANRRRSQQHPSAASISAKMLCRAASERRCQASMTRCKSAENALSGDRAQSGLASSGEPSYCTQHCVKILFKLLLILLLARWFRSGTIRDAFCGGGNVATLRGRKSNVVRRVGNCMDSATEERRRGRAGKAARSLLAFLGRYRP